MRQATTEDNSPQDTEGTLDPMMKEQSLEEEGGDGQEESPDQSISSAVPTDSGVGDGAPMSQDGMLKYFVSLTTVVGVNI